MQFGDPMKQNFEGPWNEIHELIGLKEKMRKIGYWSSHHVNSLRSGYLNVKNISFFVFFADESKTLVTVWAKYSSDI